MADGTGGDGVVTFERLGGDGSGSGSCVYEDGDTNEAAIRIHGVPPGQFITDTTIVASARHGIDWGWRADEVVDFLPSNHFEDVADWRQTVSPAENAWCPDPVPCE